MSAVCEVHLVVNGTERCVADVRPGASLLHLLRDHLGLMGAKNACEQGECGSCSVLVDGTLVCACLELAAAADGCQVTTVESFGRDELSDVQAALVVAGGVQCGFCTPGFVMAIHDLLDHRPDPSGAEIREALAGNLCRCTGYGRILAAVEVVIAGRTGAATPA